MRSRHWVSSEVRSQRECTAVLPVENRHLESEDSQAIFAFYSDESVLQPGTSEVTHTDPEDHSRSACAPSDLVFGEMAALIRFPMKLLWFESGQTLLYDLSWDRDELSDQKQLSPGVAGEMLSQLHPFLQETATSQNQPSQQSTVDSESIEALRELGYVE